MAPAPVAVFAFRRPEHLTRCLESLRACAEAASTDLVVFCDGPRGPEDEDGVAQVRAVARSAAGFASVRTIEQETNLGLAASLIAGVSRMLEDHDRVVVVEDDLVVSSDFLRFMNEGLDLYADDDRVASIHGFCYSVSEDLPTTFFLRGADCWGWATWRRAWAVFDADGARLLQRLRDEGSEDAFDLDGAYPYTAMLQDQVAGRVDSWAVRWRASTFLAGMLTLWPGRSLVQNIGQDGSGTHSIPTVSLASDAGLFPWPLERIPVEESAAARAVIASTTRRDRDTWRARIGALLGRGRRR